MVTVRVLIGDSTVIRVRAVLFGLRIALIRHVGGGHGAISIAEGRKDLRNKQEFKARTLVVDRLNGGIEPRIVKQWDAGLHQAAPPRFPKRRSSAPFGTSNRAPTRTLGIVPFFTYA